MNQYKPELGRFYGDSNPEVWVFQAERYFNFYGFSKDSWLSMPYVYFKGEALSWFDWLYRNDQFWDWNHFTEKLVIHYRNRTFENSVEYPKFKPKIAEMGSEILRQLAELRDALAACAPKLEAQELSTVESNLEDARDTTLPVPVPQSEAEISDELQLFDESSHRTNHQVFHDKQSNAVVLTSEMESVVEDSKSEQVSEVQVTHVVTSLIPEAIYNKEARVLQDFTPILHNVQFNIPASINGGLSDSYAPTHSAKQATIFEITCEKLPMGRVLDLSIGVPLGEFCRLNTACVNHTATYSYRHFEREAILWSLPFGSSADDWFDTGQKELALLPWDCGGHIDTQSCATDPTISVMEKLVIAMDPGEVICILTSMQLNDFLNQLCIDKEVSIRLLELMNIAGFLRQKKPSYVQKHRLHLRRISKLAIQQGNTGGIEFYIPFQNCLAIVLADLTEAIGNLKSHFGTVSNDQSLLTEFPFDPGDDLQYITCGISLTLGEWNTGIYSKTLPLISHKENEHKLLLLRFNSKFFSFVSSGSMTKIWDPGRQWCIYSYSFLCDFPLIVSASLTFNYFYTRLELHALSKERQKKKSRGLFVFPIRCMDLLQVFGWLVLFDAYAVWLNDMGYLGFFFLCPEFLIRSFYKISELITIEIGVVRSSDIFVRTNQGESDVSQVKGSAPSCYGLPLTVNDLALVPAVGKYVSATLQPQWQRGLLFCLVREECVLSFHYLLACSELSLAIFHHLINVLFQQAFPHYKRFHCCIKALHVNLLNASWSIFYDEGSNMGVFPVQSSEVKFIAFSWSSWLRIRNHHLATSPGGIVQSLWSFLPFYNYHVSPFKHFVNQEQVFCTVADDELALCALICRGLLILTIVKRLYQQQPELTKFTKCSTLGNEGSCYFRNNLIDTGVKVDNATIVYAANSFLYTIGEELILLKGQIGVWMEVVLLGFFLTRVCLILELLSTAPFYKFTAAHEFYLCTPLFSGDLFAHGSLDLYYVGLVSYPHSSLNKLTAVLPYLNLEDKVLIEGGSIVMNGLGAVLAYGPVGRSMWQKQPKASLSGWVWDPGG